MNSNTSFIEKMRWRLKAIEHKILQYRLTTHETAIAETAYGKVKGAKRISVYDQPYFSFEGIPYAQPPVGELRFKAPQRPTPWDGVKDCINPKDKAVQVQFIYNKVEGSEDCLYLNVYTNNLTPDSARPVMVWIHGGGFIMGEANREFYGPDYFMRKDVVLITIQYRLGVLGFLSLKAQNLNVPGNAGLKDQVLALKWVKNNCASFGGNPDCITVFGESAGAASTHYMLLTEKTEGLFHRAILQSGNAFCSWANTECSSRAYTIAKLAGYKGEENDKDVLQFLMNAKAKDLRAVEEKLLTPKDRANLVMFAFGPTVEPYLSADCVLPKPPIEMMKNAWGNILPILVGNTSYEGLFFLGILKTHPILLKDLETCLSFIPPELAAPDSEEKHELGLKIKKAHVTGETPTMENYMDICSIVHFYLPMHRFLQSHFKHAANSNVYLYRFDFDTEELINPYRIMRQGRGVKGVSHADDLTFLFWTIVGRRLNKESREYRTIERMIDIWTQFAATGNPYDEHISGLDKLSWEPLKKSEQVYKCLNISDELKVIDLPEMEKLKIWVNLYENKQDLLY